MRNDYRRISFNISYLEATKSATAKRNDILNEPNESQLENMKLLAEKVFEPLRKGLGNHPINIASFFRSAELNKVIGGAKNSQHMANNGAAMDIDLDGSKYLYNYQAFNFIKDHLNFDQLIWEFGDKYNSDWVHVSYKKDSNRMQVLKAEKKNEKTVYSIYVD